MKRLAVILMFFIFVSPLFSQSITIENDEDALFLFDVVSTDTVPTVSTMKNALETAPDSELLSTVPPRATRTGVPLEEGASIVGVFVIPGRSAYPVVFLAEPSNDYITVSTDDVHRDGDGDGEALMLPAEPVQALLDRRPILVDNDYADWREVDGLASFSSGFSPTTFHQTRAGSSREREIAESFYWGKAGTGVARLKGLVSRGNAYLMLETREGIVAGTSYYLYAYERRGQNRASATVEIAVTGGSSGFVFLWLPDQDEPRVIGEFVHDRFYLEAQVDFSRLPETLREALSSDVTETLTFDFSAAFSGARVREEFFYTTVYARDIVRQGPPGL